MCPNHHDELYLTKGCSEPYVCCLPRRPGLIPAAPSPRTQQQQQQQQQQGQSPNNYDDDDDDDENYGWFNWIQVPSFEDLAVVDCDYQCQEMLIVGVLVTAAAVFVITFSLLVTGVFNKCC